MSAEGDAQLAAAFERLIQEGPDSGEYVIVEGDTSRNYYLQFAALEGRLLCEAVSNHHLQQDDRLGEDQMRSLRELGWEEPDEGGSNWWRLYEASGTSDFADLVTLARDTLQGVYG